jgi:MraZ protein
VPDFHFTGTSTLSLDAKGRVSVPARHRETLMAQCNGKMAIFQHDTGCLKLMPWPVWERMLAAMDTWPEEAAPWKGLYIGTMLPLELDGSSRVLISPELREAVSLERDVSLAGVGSHFELWDKQRLADRNASLSTAVKPEAVRALRY